MNSKLKFNPFILILFFIVGTLSACVSKKEQSCGFVQNVYGQRITWKSKLPIHVLISSTVPESLKSAIYRAALSWEKVIGKKVFIFENSSFKSQNASDLGPARDKINGIYFLNEWDENKKSEQGRTSVYWAGDEIQEADIRINAADFKYYNENPYLIDHSIESTNDSQINLVSSIQKSTVIAYSFEALIVHEIGHFLGLKHDEEKNSVMATYLAAFSNRVGLSDQDQANITCEYN